MAVWLKLGALVALLVAGGAMLLVLPTPDTDALHAAVDDADGWAPAIFIVGYVAATLLLLPKNVLSATAGLAFGFGEGFVLVWLAAVIGASAAFWVGRWLGREGVVRLAGRHLERLDRLVERRGVMAVLVARLVPILPFTAVNYGSGVTAVRFPAYLLATAVGIVPGTIAFVSLGAYGSTPASWQFVSAASTLTVLTAVGIMVARQRRSLPTGGIDA